MADILAPLLSTGNDLYSISEALRQVRIKGHNEPPFAHEDGGGCCSKPDWNFPPSDVDNLFKTIRDEFFPELFNHDMPERVLAHFSQRLEHCPIPGSLVMKLRAILNDHIPGLSESSWSIRSDQPLCLEALQCISALMNDPDTSLFPSLLAGVRTGFDGDIPP